MAIEKIVRPFQLRDISPPKPVATATEPGSTAEETVNLQWGKSWDIRVFNTSLTISETYYAVKKMREKPKTDQNQ